MPRSVTRSDSARPEPDLATTGVSTLQEGIVALIRKRASGSPWKLTLHQFQRSVPYVWPSFDLTSANARPETQFVLS